MRTVFAHDEKLYRSLKDAVDEKDFQMNDLKLQLEFLTKDYKFKAEQFDHLEKKHKHTEATLKKADEQLVGEGINYLLLERGEEEERNSRPGTVGDAGRSQGGDQEHQEDPAEPT